MSRNNVRTAAFGLGVAALAGGAAALVGAAMARGHERQVPADGNWSEQDGARLHYLDRGDGPPALLIHGLGGQMRNFSYALTERLLPGHRVVTVDRPGSGYSTAAAGPHPGLAAQARLVAGLIERLGLDRPVIVGHSLGGAVALALALDRPDLTRGLALLAPLTQPQTDVPAAFRRLAVESAWLRAAAIRTLGVPVGRLTQDRIRRLTFAPEPPAQDFGVRGGGLLTLRAAALERAALDMIAARDEMAGLAARYGELDLPVSILFGRQDAVLDPWLHGEVSAAAIRDARLTLIEGGHMIPVTRPGETARFVEGLFARLA